MTKWEYRSLAVDAGQLEQDATTQKLNDLGVVGWELVAIIRPTRLDDAQVHYVFKRPLLVPLPKASPIPPELYDMYEP